MLQVDIKCFKCLELTAHSEYIVVLTLMFWPKPVQGKPPPPSRKPGYATEYRPAQDFVIRS